MHGRVLGCTTESGGKSDDASEHIRVAGIGYLRADACTKALGQENKTR